MSQIKQSQVNEYMIKVSMGRMVVDRPMQLGDSVRVLIEGDVTKIEQLDNQDGTHDEVYVVKGIYAQNLNENTEERSGTTAS
jgi:hypothetical protein